MDRHTVGSWVDGVRESWDGDGEPLLDLLEDLLIRLGRDKRDCYLVSKDFDTARSRTKRTQTLGTESTSSTDSVEVRIGISWCVLPCQPRLHLAFATRRIDLRS